MDNPSASETAFEVFTEDELKHMSRHVKELLPTHQADSDDRIRLLRLSKRLLATASSPSLLATHRVAAWNTLCAFIDQSSTSHVEAVQTLLWEHDIWLKAFNLYIVESQNARPKSAKQLLATLGSTLRGDERLKIAREILCLNVASYLGTDRRPKRSKALLQLLTHFLNKGLVGVKSINDALPDVDTIRHETQDGASIAKLIACLLRWASFEDFSSVTGRCISVVLDKHAELQRAQNELHQEAAADSSPPAWSSALDSVLLNGHSDIDQLRAHIFPILFKRSLPQYVDFLQSHGFAQLLHRRGEVCRGPEHHNTTPLLCAALQSGKELGIVLETDGQNLAVDNAALHVPVKALGPLLYSTDRSVRISSLAILVNSHSATRPFLSSTLAIFKASLSSFFADTDANFRSEVFSLVQRLVDRIRAITAVLARARPAQTETRSPTNDVSMPLKQHRDFLQWLVRFLTWELRPTASYQRHISALKCLSIVSCSGVDREVAPIFWSKSASAETKWSFHITILKPDLQQLLLDLLVNPFDDVRQTASSILSIYAQSSASLPTQGASVDIETTIERAEKAMLASGRADQADGVAHMYSLLALRPSAEAGLERRHAPNSGAVATRLIDDLEHMLDKAQTSLTTAAKRHPMHGLLTSIRLVIARQKDMASEASEQSRLAQCLNRVWHIVKPVLCNDAPEGLEVEDEGAGADTSSKDVLSYCWRALKESSLLLGAIVEGSASGEDIIMSLSDLCFTQLAELRHRGAFSTVAQTWTLCCSKVAAIKSSQGSYPLPLERWYRQTLDILTTRTTINTRRSAGIPSLLCGLLAAEKSDAMLSRAIQDLSSIATEPVDVSLANESSLPQVHALNCIKDILKNTRLGERSERYVPDSMRLAADSLRSEAWAIRNCGLMLFRGVIDRLLGTSDAYLEDDALVQKRISIGQHPGLLDIVLQLLVVPAADANDAATSRYEGVFPALQMLQRIDLPQDQRKRAQQAVLALTANPSWHVRDKAARTFASLSDGAEAGLPLEEILQQRIGHENAVHGALLCLKHVTIAALSFMQRRDHRQDSPDPLLARGLGAVLRAHKEAFRQQFDFAHPVTKAAWYDTLVEYMRIRCHASRSASCEDVDALQDTPMPVDFQARLPAMMQVTTADWMIQAVERATLARALACQIAWGWEICPFGPNETRENLLQTVLTLASRDADACVEFWRTLRLEVADAGRTAPQHLESLLLSAMASVLRGDFVLRVKCEMQRLLLSFFDNEVDYLEEVLSPVVSEPSSPLAAKSDQTYADQWLRLHAAVLDHGLRSNEQTGLASFISTCKAAAADDGLFSREAAASALNRLQQVWPFLAQRRDWLACDAYLIIYDLLSDDDEDIRLAGAEVVSRILRSSNNKARQTHFEPITASQRLLHYALTHLNHNRNFANEAFARSFPDLDDTVVDKLHAFSQPDTALFATEKQNLYIDTAREVRAWSQVLFRLPASTLPKQLIKDLTFWIDEGLYTLTSRLGKGGNGALGWASNDRTFVLGLQVIYGVEVLMGYVQKGGKLPMEGSEIVRKLVLFDLALEKAGASNVLWKWEVQRVLKGVVEGRVRLAWELTKTVEGKGVEGSKILENI